MARVLITVRALATLLGLAGTGLFGWQGTANAASDDAASAPRELHFCAASCFTLLLRNGVHVRADGSPETWGIERFSGDTVILHRHDPEA